jgi:D-alanyl-D-alanine carboxypeptidase/D-alanyl-D-alanine-endopeptidase (penicillin-binding protein 4)
VTRLFLKNSNNFIAESLVKSVGVAAGARQGSWKTGIPALLARLETLGLDTSALGLVDGSGLSNENRVPSRLLVSALRLVDASFELGPEVAAALPIAAVDGTLELERRAEAASGRVRAKTGLLTGATGLSGFAESAGGRKLIFSVLVNGYRGSDTEAMRALDGFVAALVSSGS